MNELHSPPSTIHSALRRSLCTLLLVPLMTAPVQAEDPQVSPYAGSPGWAQKKAERTAWFQDAKFGMFIHWGLYSPAGGYWPPDPETGKKYDQHYAEWIRFWAKVPEPEYGTLTKPLFTPEPGCTDHWAEVAREAGMAYMVLTTKHHDGYTLFNATAPYSRENPITGSTHLSPPGRDLVAEYAASARKHGLKVGYYYSIIDWQHPHATTNSRPWPTAQPADTAVYIEYMHSHIRQLFTDYGASDLLWVDYSNAEHQGSTWQTRRILDELRELQPGMIINNRFWNGLENAYGDFFTPEKYIPPSGIPGRIFEVCHTLNESFGFSHHDRNWKSTREVVHLLVDIVSKGGNLLLNVGPDARGRIPDESVRVLQETGQWLQVNGEAIYGTDASPYAELEPGIRFTRKEAGNAEFLLYAHLLDWPGDHPLRIRGLKNEVLQVSLLGTDAPLQAERDGEDLSIPLPDSAPNPHCAVVAVRIKGAPEIDELALLPRQQPDRTVTVAARDMDLQGPHIRITPAQGEVPEHVSYWLNHEAGVTLTFRVTSPGPVQPGGTVTRQPGRYAVMLHQAVDENAGGRLRLATGDGQALEAEVVPTGSWQTYETLNIGEITLIETGPFEITLTPESVHPPGFMNLSRLELIPLN